MTLERVMRESQEIATPHDKTYFYTALTTAAVQMTVMNRVMRITNDFAFTLSLPSVAEAAGLTFSISTVNATAAVTLTDFGGSSYNDSINWEGDFTLDAAEDTISLYSDGRTWHQVDRQIA